MVDRLINLCKLVTIIRERGNFPLIRRSRKQLQGFLLCRGGMNRQSIIRVLPYWFYLLKGLDVLVWRLETFGLLYLPGQSAEDKQRLNSRL
ncbi:hypothetical protein MNBD_NITROSPINAE05-20 [hydrothermal vent metagenome]|uniref:Uncharacterized protein n=1 Tax=hydrothermal vent metagenome TaxID=652676 RepID=A0A3B1CW94_9ZZZZ